MASGGVIAYPTEAVYGLGCDPFNAAAVARILTLKRRRPHKGLIVVAAEFRQLLPLLNLHQDLPLDQILATWPGPVTWVMPASTRVPHWLRGDRGGIAVRVSAHPLVRELCGLTGALVSTSANPEDRVPARTAARVRAYFANRLDLIVPGTTGGRATPTVIRDAVTGRQIR